tara:strand:+ start:341 stop:517 length:177 start_codon:yes stop_codon:yes gene_type:complete
MFLIFCTVVYRRRRRRRRRFHLGPKASIPKLGKAGGSPVDPGHDAVFAAVLHDGFSIF